MTLIEMTIVILVLLSLITTLFFGARAWKRGSDRTLCIINIRNVQQGVRAYANINGFSDGGSAPDLKSKVIGLGKYIEALPDCPSSGTYAFGGAFGENTIPPVGELYMQCDLETADNHVPTAYSDW